MFDAPAYEVIERSAFAKSNPIWNEIIKPIYTAAGANKSAVDPQLVFDSLYKSVIDRKLTTTQAADFYAGLFTQATASNNAIHQFRKWTGMEQIGFGVTLTVGKRPITEMSMTAVQATGAAMALSGVATLPGAAIAAAGTVGQMMLGNKVNIEATNRVEVQRALGLSIASELGLELNTEGEVSPKRRGLYNQPIFKSTLVNGK